MIFTNTNDDFATILDEKVSIKIIRNMEDKYGFFQYFFACVKIAHIHINKLKYIKFLHHFIITICRFTLSDPDDIEVTLNLLSGIRVGGRRSLQYMKREKTAK